MEAANEAILTIALIESARGIDNAEAILATPGLDFGVARPLRSVGQPRLRRALRRSALSRRRSEVARGGEGRGQAAGLARADRRRRAARGAARLSLPLHRPRSRRLQECIGAGVRCRAHQGYGRALTKDRTRSLRWNTTRRSRDEAQGHVVGCGDRRCGGRRVARRGDGVRASAGDTARRRRAACSIASSRKRRSG